MSAHTPEEIHLLFAEHFAAGDLDAIIALYEPDATLVPQPGQPVRGLAAIREALRGFLAMGGTFAMEAPMVVRGPDLALLFARWTLDGTAPDGSAIALAGHTSDVARRQADGTWLLAIDNPFGADGAV